MDNHISSSAAPNRNFNMSINGGFADTITTIALSKSSQSRATIFALDEFLQSFQISKYATLPVDSFTA